MDTMMIYEKIQHVDLYTFIAVSATIKHLHIKLE
jgi:hypothetical protein